MAATMSPVPHRVWYSFDTISGHLYQPSTGIVWHPYNPYYDPGPPPPPRPPRPEAEQGVGHENHNRAVRGRFRHNRTRPQRPLSPTASDFVPGLKEHSPSPSPSPVPGFAPTPRSHNNGPRVSDVRPAAGFSVDMDGFPRLPRVPRAQHMWQPQPVRPRPFRGGPPSASGMHPQAGRGRGRGRGFAPIAVAPSG